eukprot:2808243-Rhodomonas_salina.2
MRRLWTGPGVRRCTLLSGTTTRPPPPPLPSPSLFSSDSCCLARISRCLAQIRAIEPAPRAL